MNLSHLAASCVIFITTLGFAQQPGTFYLKDGDNVVFYGDSITEQRLYTAIVQAFVTTRYPNLNVSFVNSGWSGDTVYGGAGGPIDTRLKRDVFPFHPDVVTIMLGMNDGAYQPATEANNQKFYTGYEHIIESLRTNLPSARITAIKPSPYDNVTRQHASSEASNFEYNETLRGFGMWISNYAKQEHLDTADLNTNEVAMLRNAYQIDPEGARTIIADQVHPSFAGHMVMAEELLKAWGARAVVSSVTIDASTPTAKVDSVVDTKVTDLSNTGSISWTQLDDALPLPFKQWEETWGSGAAVTLVIKSSDITEALNRQILKVRRLNVGTYSIKMDGNSIGVFNSDELDKGVNLALLNTPSTEQAMKVYQLVVSQENVHFDWWRHIEVPLLDDGLQHSTAAIDAMKALEGEIGKKAREVAQPTPHHFEVVLVR